MTLMVFLNCPTTVLFFVFFNNSLNRPECRIQNVVFWREVMLLLCYFHFCNCCFSPLTKDSLIKVKLLANNTGGWGRWNVCFSGWNFFQNATMVMFFIFVTVSTFNEKTKTNKCQSDPTTLSLSTQSPLVPIEDFNLKKESWRYSFIFI